MVTSAKQAALTLLNKMPENASLEELMYKLYFRQRVDRGIRESREGKTVSHGEVKRSLAKWLRKQAR
jgi:predicted transcriptional regulator